MALSLGVSIGSEITLGPDNVLKVLDIVGGTQVKVQINGGKVFDIDDSERQEVLPDVFVSCGLSTTSRGAKTSRLAFEAPLSVKIDRPKAKKHV